MVKLLISICIFLILNICNIHSAASTYVYSTINATEALRIFLRGDQTVFNPEDGLCKPLNANDRAMYDYINGDKVCYLALKHPYNTRRKRSLMNRDRYKKAECLNQPIILIKKAGSTIEQNTEATSCNYINKDGTEDIFYVANTNRIDHYAILEPVNNLLPDILLLKFSVVAILELKWQKIKNTKELQEYFKTDFSKYIFWETFDHELALKMFKIRGRLTENYVDYVSNKLMYGVQTIADYLNADKICYVALRHPYMVGKNRVRLYERPKSSCWPHDVLMSDKITGPTEKELVCCCLYSYANGLQNSFYIANTSRLNYYAILEKVESAEDTKKLKVVAILNVLCTNQDFSQMHTYFSTADFRGRKIMQNVLKKPRNI